MVATPLRLIFRGVLKHTEILQNQVPGQCPTTLEFLSIN